MRRLVLLAVLGLLAGCAAPTTPLPSRTVVARPAEKPQHEACSSPWSALRADGEHAGWKFTEMPDALRKSFLNAFNRAPPVTHVVADHVYLGAVTDQPDVAAVAIVRGECVLAAVLMPVAELRQLLGSSI